MDVQKKQTDLEKLLGVYEFILNKLDEGIHVVDESGKTIIYNSKMAEIESMQREDVLDKPILEVFQFQSDEQSTLLQALNNGQTPRNAKQTYFNNKGQEITTLNNTYPIIESGKVIGAVEIAQDVSKMERLIQENILKKGNTRYTFKSIIGESQAIYDVIEDSKRATRTNSSVLIVGETGTGKELFAQSIHNGSARASGPFVSQNCAALPDTLIEGLLFGTTRGAFTGSVDRPGLLEVANGGTLLLDELNSLSPALQAKLLRVIQERTIRRVGDTKDTPVDVRIIATINEDPLDAIMQNRLRKDLYYRLSVVTIFIPPLRERKEDIPLLVKSFVEKYNELFGMHVRHVTEDVMAMFQAYNWPGNVRELEHVIEGAMNMSGDDSVIQFRHLPFHMRRKLNTRGDIVQIDQNLGVEAQDEADFSTLQGHVKEYERNFIQSVLKKHHGKISAAARELGMSRQSLQYRLKKLNIHAKSLSTED